jgi:hypothetical protein
VLTVTLQRSLLELPNGTDWTGDTQVGSQTAVGGTIAAFDNELVLVYQAFNSSHDMLATTSTNGTDWTGDTQAGNQSSYEPSLTASTWCPPDPGP